MTSPPLCRTSFATVTAHLDGFCSEEIAAERKLHRETFLG